ncbi:MAG: DUF2079 domain-containing protein [Snowella sp.]|nr:DUF2079 domain-containing protein [Snowella sp.]
MFLWLQKRFIKIHPLFILISVSSLILFLASSIKHILYQSTAFDLGFFDQAIYLISVNLPPIVSFNNIHILGDHAALIFYPISLLYKLYPSVYWLFAIQAIALSMGALPAYYLAQESNLTPKQCLAIAIVYLLYPLVFNVNLFDFHPDVIALPALLWAVLSARQQKLGQFIGAIAIILSCKAVLSLTVAFLGIWLLLHQKTRRYGLIALIAGAAWFGIATQLIIPHFRTQELAGISRYSFLGNSVSEIIINLILKPQLVLSYLFTGVNFGYLLLLCIPLLWGLSWRHLDPLIPALPALFLNLLSDYDGQKDLLTQYSLPVFPFLLLAVIAALADGKTLIRRPRWIMLWSLVSFFALAKGGFFTSRYLSSLDTWQATNAAIAQIQTQGGVLTSAEIAPHVTHRPLVKMATDGSETLDFNQFEYVLLNKRHPGWQSSPELIDQLIRKIEKNANFQKIYFQDDVSLFSNTLLK